MSASNAAGPTRPTTADYLKESGADLRRIARDAFALGLRRWTVLAGFLLLALAAAWLLLPNEMNLLRAIQAMGSENPAVRSVAKGLSRWGDIHTGSLIVVGVLWVAGFAVGADCLRKAAVACLLAAVAAGVFSDVFRYGLGRARPNSGYADGLYGFQRSSKFHGFPSGHTSTAFGTMTPLAVMFPQAAVPCLAAAAAVGWSRLYLDYHRPSDVLVGGAVGISFGALAGFAARRRSPAAEAETPCPKAVRPE